MVRCVIVDDNRSFLQAATRLLERDGLTVAAVASTGEEAVEVIERERPDVVLLDISLGADSGFEVARRLAESHVEAKVLLISTHSEADFAELIEESPAVGFLSKSELSSTLVKQLITSDREG